MPEDIDLLFIVDSFGEHKDLALHTAHLAKSKGVLVVGIPIVYTDIEDMRKAREIFDAIVIGLSPSAIIRAISELLIKKDEDTCVNFEDINNALCNTGTAYAVSGYAEGDNRAKHAALKAENGASPALLETEGTFPEGIIDMLINREDKNNAAEVLHMLFGAGMKLPENYMNGLMIYPEILHVFISYGWNVNTSTEDGTGSRGLQRGRQRMFCF